MKRKNGIRSILAGAVAALALPLLAAAPAVEPPAQDAPAAEERVGDPYPLATCPVSGRELGSMGEPVVKVYDGREVRLCCAGCIERFEANREEHFKRIDEKIVESQDPFYPLAVCPVSKQPLGSMGEPVEVVYGNRLVRFCCSHCQPRFERDLKASIQKLDEVVVAQQREAYPLDTCVVSGEKLGSMGEPVEIVIGHRLIRLCCDGCVEKLEAKPATHLKTIDEAWEKAGGVPKPKRAREGGR